MRINDPETLAELQALFPPYETALVANDAETLTRMFWASPHVTRFGITENLHGSDEIAAFRKGRPLALTVTGSVSTSVSLNACWSSGGEETILPLIRRAEKRKVNEGSANSYGSRTKWRERAGRTCHGWRLTTVLLVGFRTDWLRREHTMKTAGRENPNSPVWLCTEPSPWGGRPEPSLLIYAGWKVRKDPAAGEVFFLTSPLIERDYRNVAH